MKCDMERENLAPGVKPLTDEERAWIRSLERVLKAMPKRLLLIEIADSMTVVDREAAHGVDLYDGWADRNGVALCGVRNSFGKLTGVSG